MDKWNILLKEAAEYDAEQLSRKKRLEGGLRGHKIMQVFMAIQDSVERGPNGFCLSEYELPFEEKQMKSDIKEWSEYRGGKYVVKVDKIEKKIEVIRGPAKKDDRLLVVDTYDGKEEIASDLASITSELKKFTQVFSRQKKYDLSETIYVFLCDSSQSNDNEEKWLISFRLKDTILVRYSTSFEDVKMTIQNWTIVPGYSQGMKVSTHLYKTVDMPEQMVVDPLTIYMLIKKEPGYTTKDIAVNKPKAGEVKTEVKPEVPSEKSNSAHSKKKKKEEEPHWPPNEVIDRDLAIRLQNNSQASKATVREEMVRKEVFPTEPVHEVVLREEVFSTEPVHEVVVREGVFPTEPVHEVVVREGVFPTELVHEVVVREGVFPTELVHEVVVREGVFPTEPVDLSVQYYNSSKDNWTKNEGLTPSTTLEKLCEKMVQYQNARIYVGKELAMVLYRTGSFEGDLRRIKEPIQNSKPIRNALNQENIWMIMANWYWQNFEVLRVESYEEGLISNMNEYPRAIIYWKDGEIIHTLFDQGALLNGMDRVHGKNMGLRCIVMP